MPRRRPVQLAFSPRRPNPKHPTWVHQRRDDFRVVHYGLMSTHLHLIVEANDKRALSNGKHCALISPAEVPGVPAKAHERRRAGPVAFTHTPGPSRTMLRAVQDDTRGVVIDKLEDHRDQREVRDPPPVPGPGLGRRGEGSYNLKAHVASQSHQLRCVEAQVRWSSLMNTCR
jgi:hypothetical protein